MCSRQVTGFLILAVLVLPGCCCPNRCSPISNTPLGAWADNVQDTCYLTTEWMALESKWMRDSMACRVRKLRQRMASRTTGSATGACPDPSKCSGFEPAKGTATNPAPVPNSVAPNKILAGMGMSAPQAAPNGQPNATGQSPSCAVPNLIPGYQTPPANITNQPMPPGNSGPPVPPAADVPPAPESKASSATTRETIPTRIASETTAISLIPAEGAAAASPVESEQPHPEVIQSEGQQKLVIRPSVSSQSAVSGDGWQPSRKPPLP